MGGISILKALKSIKTNNVNYNSKPEKKTIPVPDSLGGDRMPVKMPILFSPMAAPTCINLKGFLLKVILIFIATPK
jgi:hypothetical protein